MFTHAPVPLWEGDFSEVKRRFNQLKRHCTDDVRKYFKKHPEEVLALARMVKIVRVNNETLRLYDAAGTVDFREGRSLIFNKNSFEVFKEELIAFWMGRTSFTSEKINLTLAGASKIILIHVCIPPGFEHNWAKVCVAITDITEIEDRMRNLAVSERKYRSVFNAVQTAVLLADLPTGVIIEVNKSTRRLFGESDNELVGLHLADMLQGEESDGVRALLHLHANRPGSGKQVFHIRHRNKGLIPVFATANAIEGDANVIVMSLVPAGETLPMRSAESKVGTPYVDPGTKLTQREH